MQFRLLGPLEVDGPNGPIVIAAPRQQVVISVLALAPNHVVSADQLIAAIWGESPPQTARAQIQICVSHLRRHLTSAGLPGSIITRPPGYLLRIPEGESDVDTFERLTMQGRAARDAVRPEEAARLFGSALALWRGEPLAEVESEVLRAAATRLQQRRICVIEDYAEVRLRLGEGRDLVDELMELATEYPLRERLCGQVMVALDLSGRRAEALEWYRRTRATCVAELGIEPGDELQLLHRSILNGEAQATVPVAPRGGPARRASAEPGAEIPQQLPAAAADFVGRTSLVELVHRYLLTSMADSDDSRSSSVVLLTGGPGTGKTTLAVQVAHQLSDVYPDGQLFASLGGSSTDPVPAEHVVEGFLYSLGVPADAMPPRIEDRAALFRSQLASRQLLVVLDDVANEVQIRPLLPGAGRCAVIATARSRLVGLAGAMQAEVPSSDDYEAVRLLCGIIGEERVGREASDASRLVELCDHWPIAARAIGTRLAARPHWTLAEMVGRLTDPDGARLDELEHPEFAVRYAIASTYERLRPTARKLLCLTAELQFGHVPAWVAGPLLAMNGPEADESLEELADAYLLTADRTQVRSVRFVMASLVRAFARERFAAGESTADGCQAIRRVAQAWLFMVHHARVREYGSGEVTGGPAYWSLPDAVVQRELADPRAWYEANRDSLVEAAIRVADCDAQLSCDLALAMVEFFEDDGDADRWRRTHEAALNAVRGAGNAAAENALLRSLRALHAVEEQMADAARRLTSMISLFEELSAVRERRAALRNLAFLGRIRESLDEAVRRHEDSVRSLRRCMAMDHSVFAGGASPGVPRRAIAE